MSYYRCLGLVILACFLGAIDVSAGGLRTKPQKITQPEQPGLQERIKLISKRNMLRQDWDNAINFSKEQKSQLKEIYVQSNQKVEELVTQIEEAQQKIQDVYAEENLQIREILDEQQKIKFDQANIRLKKMRGEKVTDKKPSRKKMRVY